MIKNLAIGSVSGRMPLVIGLLLGVVAAVLTGLYLSQAKNGGGAPAGATQPVVVAASDIPANTRISEDMVTVKALPQAAVLPNVFKQKTDVVGQVTQVPIAAGEQVLPSKVTTSAIALAQFGDNAPLSLIVPQGRRGFSVKVSPVAAAGGLVRPGDYVDVILSGAAAGVSNGQAFLSTGSACYLVQDVEVLAVGETVKKVATQSEAAAVASAGTQPEAVSATLAVTPEEAWWLAAAQQSVDEEKVGNQLWVAVRPFGEHGPANNLPVCGVIPGS